MVNAHPSLIATTLQKLAETTRLDGHLVVCVPINKLAPWVWLVAMRVSGPTPVLGAITHRIVIAPFVDNIFNLHRHLYVLQNWRWVCENRDVWIFKKHQSDSYLDYLLDLDGRVDVDNLLNFHRHWHLHVFSTFEMHLQEQRCGQSWFRKSIMIPTSTIFSTSMVVLMYTIFSTSTDTGTCMYFQYLRCIARTRTCKFSKSTSLIPTSIIFSTSMVVLM